MTKELCTLTASVFLLPFVCPAQCSLVVATNGNDSNPGTISAPLATPGVAMQRAAAGDVICVRGGNYQVVSGIIADKSVTIQSYPGEWAVLSSDNSSSSPVSSLIWVAANNVTVRDIELIGASYYSLNINSSYLGFPPTNTVIQGVKIHGSGYTGIKSFQADNLQILDCEVYGTGVTIAGGSGFDLLASLPSSSNPSGPGVTVRGNYVHDLPYSGIVVKAGTVNGLVEQNRVERIAGGGIYAGGDTSAPFFRNNATTECTNCEFRNNVVDTVDAEGIGCWASQGTRIVNNTVFNAARTSQASLYAVIDEMGYACTNATIANNVVVNSSSRPLVHLVDPGPGISFDHNDYYSTIGNYQFWLESSTAADYWTSLGAWQSGAGQDAHSIGYQDPMLDASNLYRQLPGSVLIDKGVTLTDVANDYAGVKRPQGPAYDIGAFELPVASATPALMSIVSGSNQSATINSAFASALSVKVTDTSANPVAGYNVTFTAPASGASATFGGASSATVITNSNGIAASPSVQANGIAGTYTVMASAPSLSPVNFSLTNTPAPVPTATMMTGGYLTPTQSGITLTCTVTSSGSPVTGGTVQFYLNGSAFGSPGSVNNGRATVSSALPSGIGSGSRVRAYAAYSGSSTDAASRSNAVIYVIQ